MRISDPGLFIMMGGQLRYLASRSEGDNVFEKNCTFDNLTRFRAQLEKFGFAVSVNLFDQFFSGLMKEFSTLARNSDDKDSVELTSQQAELVRDSILKLETTVFAESKTRIIAVPVPRRIELTHLLQTPEKVLGKDVYSALTELAQSDIQAACRCIAFECATAAAFHVLRAVEECVRVLYKAYFPRGNEKRPWGALTTELKNKPRKPIPDLILMTHLDHIRQRFRNPTDHPEKIYEIEEAEDLTSIAVDIINRCMRDERVTERRQR